MQYDVVTGVSAGAINGGAMSLFEIGDEENMVNVLSEKWQELTTDQLFKMWEPLGLVTGVLRESGVLDTSPLLKFIEDFWKEFGPVIKRRLVVSSVDALNGDYVLFNETTDDPAKAILSSASIPFAFPFQDWTIDNKQVIAIDGGSVWNTNLVSAVERCMEIVDDESKVTLDIIECTGYELAPWKDRNDALNNILRYQDVKGFHDDTADINEFKQAFPKVNYRYFVAPATPLASGLGILDADNSTSTFPMQLLGRQDGADAVKAGESFMFRHMDKWNSDGVIRAQYPRLSGYLSKIKEEQTEHISRAKADEYPQGARETIEPQSERLDFLQG